MNTPDKKPSDQGCVTHGNSGKRKRSPSLAAVAAAIVAEVLFRTLMQLRKQLRLTAHEESDLPARVVAEFQRYLPPLVFRMIIVGLLPDIRNRLYLKFLKSRIPRNDADDLAQEVVYKVLNALNDYGCPRGNIGAWLARIAHSVASDHFRKLKRKKEVGDSALGSIIDGPSEIEEFHAWEERGYSAHEMHNGIPEIQLTAETN